MYYNKFRDKDISISVTTIGYRALDVVQYHMPSVLFLTPVRVVLHGWRAHQLEL